LAELLEVATAEAANDTAEQPVVNSSLQLRGITGKRRRAALYL